MITPNVLERSYPLRLSDFDKNNRILPSSVLDLFQDAAGLHATTLGIGGVDLLKKKQCWMLTRIRYEVIRQPKLYETVTVRTWPIESKRIELDRDYLILDGAGEIIIKGSSQWVVMDITDRNAPKLVPARDFDMGIEEYLPDRAIEKPFGRAVYNSVVSDAPHLCRSAYTDLDMNCHVNNIKYADFALNAFGEELSTDEEVIGFRIDFQKEILDGEIIKIHHTASENEDGTKTITCRGETDAASVKFGVSFRIKSSRS